ncbi:MAG: FkbM family methyltransferase [Ruminococcus flavefaciens]|nr:FkbM family methyltransferase [Ruminococcus flavefaciens]
MNSRDKLCKVIESAKASGRYCKQTMIQSHKNVCVYGLGKLFEDTFEDRNMAEVFHVNYLSDSNTEKLSGGEGYSGISYVMPEELREIDDLIVILMLRNTAELEKMFLDWGIPYVLGFELLLEMSLGKIVTEEQFESNRILEVYDLLEEEAKETYVELLANRLAPELAEKSYTELYHPDDYFNGVYFPITEEENFVDCGAYNGDTIRELLEKVNGFRSVHAFEIDNENYDNLVSYVQTLSPELSKRVNVYHVGVWNEHKKIEYGNEEKSSNESFSILKASNVKSVFVEKLDDILNNEDITFIKMDIEGSELLALQGSETIIRMQKPKLAVCLYHKIEDFWEIPMYLHSLVPEYRFGILHHKKDIFYDSVLYVWCG